MEESGCLHVTRHILVLGQWVWTCKRQLTGRRLGKERLKHEAASKTDQEFCSQDTVTGFLLAGVGNVDLRRNTNYLVVNESECYFIQYARRAAAVRSALRIDSADSAEKCLKSQNVPS